MALKDKLMTLEDFKAVRDVDVASNSAQFTEIKADLGNITASIAVNLTTNGYIRVKNGLIDLTPIDNSSWKHAIVSCTEGDIFTINGYSGGDPRAWFFVDENNAPLSRADALTTYSNEVVVAPKNTSYIVINNTIENGNVSYKGLTDLSIRQYHTDKTLDNIELNLDELREFIYADWAKGVANTSGGVTSQKFSYCTAQIIKFDRDITIYVEAGYQAFLRYYENSVYTSSSSWFTTSINVPANQQFMITVKLNPQDENVTADPSYAKKVYVTTILNDRFESLNERITTLENQTNLNTQWNNKKWVAFGCSLSDSDCAMPYPEYTGEVTGKYPAYLSALSGLIHINYAKGGSTISDAEHTNADGVHPTAIQKLQEAINNDVIDDADLITLEGCVNDWSNGTPLGTLTDKTDATICGSLYLFLTTAMAANPNATIIVISDSTGKSYLRPNTVVPVNVSYDKKNSIQLYQSEYIQQMKEYCEFMGVIFIDAGQDSEINSLHPQYIGDHIHHTDEGGEQFANAIWSKLKNIQPNVT